jgi:hypothetical protein
MGTIEEEYKCVDIFNSSSLEGILLRINKDAPQGTMNIALTAYEIFYLHCVCCGKNEHGSKNYRIPCNKIKEYHKLKENKMKTPKPTQFVIDHCNNRINE